MKSNMKSLFFLLPALLLSLASCNTNTSTTSSNGSSTSSSTSSSSQSSSSSSVKPTDPTIETALASLKQNNHTVDIDFTVRVLHPKDEYAVDIEIHRQEQRSFSYNVLEDKSIEKGYHVEGSSTNCDLDKETGDYVETTRRVYPITPLTIFEDTENGLAVMETLNVQNEVDYAYLSEYDADTGVYDPVVFDTDYINPWDYINAEDFSYDSDGILHLDLEKAEFLAESYGASSVNWATDCTVSLNSSNQIAKVDFTIPDIEGENFERVSKMTLLYSDFGKETVNHLAPLTNDNPHLATALKCLLNAKNFTYKKTITIDGVSALTTGYYDKEHGIAYFHQGDKDSMYTAGDNYDYVAAYQTSGANKDQYVGYNYISGDETSYAWSPITVSSSALYTIPTWDDLIPAFDQVSPNIFTEENGVYTPISSLVPSIGSYFDNPFLGVNSEALTTDGTAFSITLDGDTIKQIDAVFESSGTTYEVKFELSAINHTTLPQFFLDSWNTANGGIFND